MESGAVERTEMSGDRGKCRWDVFYERRINLRNKGIWAQ